METSAGIQNLVGKVALGGDRGPECGTKWLDEVEFPGEVRKLRPGCWICPPG